MTIRSKIDGIGEIWQFANRWQLVFNRLLFRRESLSVYRYKGLEILIDHAAGDANGAREVLAGDMYRKFLPLLDLSGEINVLDLGSNNGGFPLLLSSEGIKIKNLVCVEFNPNTFSRMRFNIERNLDCGFTPLNAAVCGTTGEITRTFGAGGTSESIYSDSDGSNVLTVKSLTLDDIYNMNFANEVVDLCKIDIEGAEFEVFGGAGALKIVKCRYLLIEIHHEPDRPRSLVRDALNEIGFEEFEPALQANEFHHVHLFINKHLCAE